MANLVGQSLGKYKLLSWVGRGGYADVYKGEHTELGTVVAIKVLKTSGYLSIRTFSQWG